MVSMRPTVLVYGSPRGGRFLKQVAEAGWGLVMDNGAARDVVFTIYENFARADAILLFPNAHPAHMISVIAEAEVGHPLILQEKPAASGEMSIKPIIFFGTAGDWKRFHKAFAAMQTQGLLRQGFDRAVTYCSTFEAVQRAIESRLPATIPLTRIHYYAHTRKQADLSVEERNDVRPPSEITIACFGSASTKNQSHIERTDRVARMLARNDWNILHGGGTSGVMGQLSKSGAQYKVHVTGVTVHSSGAPKISFERADGGKRPEEIDQQIASKDMLHRIETYAGHSNAFVSLDGGIGSVQEVLVIAELITKEHPAVVYNDVLGQRVTKPLVVLNESGCYTPLLDYLKKLGMEELLSVIKEVKSVDTLNEALETHFKSHRPAGVTTARPFRELYALSPEPRAVPHRTGGAREKAVA